MVIKRLLNRRVNSSEKQLEVLMHLEGQHQWDAANTPGQKMQSEEKTVPGASQSQKPWTARRCSFKRDCCRHAVPPRRVESRQKYTESLPCSLILSMSLISWTQRRQGQSSLSDAVSPAPESKEQGREGGESSEPGAGVEWKPTVIWVLKQSMMEPLFVGKTVWVFHLFP